MLASRICPLLPITDTHAKMPSHTYTSKPEVLETVHVPVAATAHPPNVWELKKKKLIYTLLLSMRSETFTKPSETWKWTPTQDEKRCPCKSIRALMSAIILFSSLKLFSCPMFIRSACHYVPFRLVSAITKPSFGLKIICLQILGDFFV